MAEPSAQEIARKLDLPQDVMLTCLPVASVRERLDTLLSSHARLRQATEGMAAKRCAEFVAGRLCADQSLRRLGVPAEFPLPAPSRLPLWPAGTLGSISHCSSLAVAAAARKSEYRALGVDVETLISPKVAKDIQSSIAREDELIALEKHVPCRWRSMTMLFSAKEALFKALYPQTGRFMDFDAAQCHDCRDGWLDLCLIRDWSSQWRTGTKVRVRHAWIGDTVIAAACIPLAYSHSL